MGFDEVIAWKGVEEIIEFLKSPAADESLANTASHTSVCHRPDGVE